MTTGTPKTKAALEHAGNMAMERRELKALKQLEEKFRFSHQQLKQTAEWMVDCRMWDEPSFPKGLAAALKDVQMERRGLTITQQRTLLFQSLKKQYQKIRGKEKQYPSRGRKQILPHYRIEDKELKGRFYRQCQAHSELGVCCGLRVLNLVDNCAMDCAYCILQNHYDQAVVRIPVNLKRKLASLKIPTRERLRIGTGEHTDSLLWGNRNGMLTDLCGFAGAHPNIILELKTKSDNIGFFLKNQVPANVCCAWTLNTQTVITHEEHKTSGLKGRLKAARRIADRGIKVGFHLHPMVYYRGWQKEYRELIQLVISMFDPHEVLWFSLGTITVIKDLESRLRKTFRNSKILQMESELTPDKKTTYAYPVRKKLYDNALEALEPWTGMVVQYLCMEFPPMWKEVMGCTFEDKDGLNKAINESAFAKLK
ncbi:radical SAM protein [Fibrobacterota bacterium]